MTSALVVVAALLAAPVQSDTVVELRRGDRVLVTNLSGDVSVEGWDRDELQVSGQDGRPGLSARRVESGVQLSPDGLRGSRRSVDVTIRVPRWAELEISGLSLDLTVRDVDGELRVGNVRGEIRILDVGGFVDVRSLEGEISVEDARAGLRASSQADDVVARRISGPVEVHSGSGDVLLEDIRSESVRAETQDGDVSFSGAVSERGSYGFFVHDGDAMIALPASVAASVGVSTFDGEFRSEFPVVVQRFTGGREFDFELGGGGARVEIQVFDGEIRLLRRR